MDFAEFVLCKELEGHGGPVNALLFSDDGKLLVSGGDDERVRVWDTETFKCLQTFKDERWGQVTTLTWIYHASRNARHITWLCIGSGRGLATLCPLSDRSPDSLLPLATKRAIFLRVFSLNDPVESVAYDCENSRLVFASHSGRLSMYNFDIVTSSFQEAWSKKITDAIPRAVFFLGGGHRNLLTLCLETAELCCWEAEDCQHLWTKNLAGGIGSATISMDEQFLVVQNLTTGMFDLYQIPSDTPLRSFQPASTRRFTKQCVFMEDSDTLVTGSVKNEVRVMDVASGQHLQVMKTAKEDMLQTVAVSTAQPDRHLIAGGSGSTPAVYLWERLRVSETAHDRHFQEIRRYDQSEKPENTVNGPVILLVLILTYSNWSPYVFRFFSFILGNVSAMIQYINGGH